MTGFLVGTCYSATFFGIFARFFSTKVVFFGSHVAKNVFSFFFGVGIEVLQSRLTSTRNGDFFDVLANFSGAILAFVFVFIAKQIKNNQSYNT